MIVIKVKTALSLGLLNLFRVLIYKLGIRTGLNSVKKINSPVRSGEFFSAYIGEAIELTANTRWKNKQTYFGNSIDDSSIPNWHQSCLTYRYASKDLPWFAISDFDSEVGDIKGIWEASRFDWVVSFAQQAKNGDTEALAKLNLWINDWVVNNPPYYGVNWKCGQEASIRVMHLALASTLLKQTSDSSVFLIELIKAHLKRISPTIMYAVAQDNNHGTSEAAALFIGGSWLVLNGYNEGKKWKKQGLKWLEDRASRLIENDGSFSQYSINYHRVMLDTYCLAEYWRKTHNLSDFSGKLHSKIKAAVYWLFVFTNPNNGDAPNLGANDGARLIPLTDTDYRDFRPSVQLASVLFNNTLAFNGEGDFNLVLSWLELTRPNTFLADKKSTDFKNGGYAFLTNSKCNVYFNYPRFKFRPSQCDALHIDLWVADQNIFRDGGTFSYNAGLKYIDYYGGAKSHNTVQFDEHEQMPRLSRFLLGDWLKTSFKKALKIDGEQLSVAAGYKDLYGCIHKRFLMLSKSSLVITDELSGFKKKAILRFRLLPANWKIIEDTLVSNIVSIQFSSNVKIKRLELISGFESRYYYKESQISVLELEIVSAGTITTEVKF